MNVFEKASISEAIVPVLRAIEAARIVRIDTVLFIRIRERTVEDGQGFVRTGLFPNVLVASRRVLVHIWSLNSF